MPAMFVPLIQTMTKNFNTEFQEASERRDVEEKYKGKVSLSGGIQGMSDMMEKIRVDVGRETNGKGGDCANGGLGPEGHKEDNTDLAVDVERGTNGEGGDCTSGGYVKSLRLKIQLLEEGSKDTPGSQVSHGFMII